MKKIILRSLVVVAVVAMIAGCSRPGIKGDGVIKTEERAIPGFTKVVIAGDYQVKWVSSKSGLNISSDENLLPLIKTEVSGDTLRISSDENLSPTKKSTVTISSPSLVDVHLTGGNRFAAEGLAGQELKVTSTGASEVVLAGSVTALDAELIGASRLDAKSLKTQTATLKLVGASEAEVTVAEALKASLTGACSVRYGGNPKTVDQKVTGAGSVQPR